VDAIDVDEHAAKNKGKICMLTILVQVSGYHDVEYRVLTSYSLELSFIFFSVSLDSGKIARQKPGIFIYPETKKNMMQFAACVRRVTVGTATGKHHIVVRTVLTQVKQRLPFSVAPARSYHYKVIGK
jgi:hypothetical protein